MRTYVLRRFLQTIPLLLALSFLTFVLLQASPGDFLAGLAQDPNVSTESLDAMRRRFGLDQPWWTQYLLYLKNVCLHLDFGQSFSKQQPVARVIGEAFGNTLVLTVAGAVVTWALAIPLGVIAAVRQNSAWDRGLQMLAFVWLSVPEILSGLLLVYFAATTHWFPTSMMHAAYVGGMGPLERFGDLLHHLALPALVLGMVPLASRMRQMRASLLDVLRLDYVTTARAKGLGERAVIFKHALRNALNPMITLFGFTLGALLSGSFVVETIFSWPGLGSITLEAIQNEDQYLVLGSVMMAATMLVVGNLAADLMLALADPRLRHE